MKLSGTVTLEFLLNNFDFEKSNKQIKQGFIIEGGCFSESQSLVVKGGNKKISEIISGDKVLTFNHQKGDVEFKPVLHLIKKKNKGKSYRITLKNGSIIEVTNNHKFFFSGRYIEVKNIVSLWKKQNENNKKDIFNKRETD